MTDFEFGDIVLVPFPFTDQSSIKKRPAVVVSSATYNRDRPDIIIRQSRAKLLPLHRWGLSLCKTEKPQDC